MDAGGSTDHSNKPGPGGSMALRHQHGLRWLYRPQASAWPSVVTEAMDINLDPSCYRATNLDIAIGSSLGMDVFMAPGDSGYSARHGLVAAWFSNTNTATGGSPDPRHSCGLW